MRAKIMTVNRRTREEQWSDVEHAYGETMGGSLPLPETVTVGKLSRLVGGSCSVGVGVAVTAPMAARAEANAKPFMMNRYRAVKQMSMITAVVV